MLLLLLCKALRWGFHSVLWYLRCTQTAVALTLKSLNPILSTLVRDLNPLYQLIILPFRLSKFRNNEIPCICIPRI